LVGLGNAHGDCSEGEATEEKVHFHGASAKPG
jgi:hypothetical protein